MKQAEKWRKDLKNQCELCLMARWRNGIMSLYHYRWTVQVISCTFLSQCIKGISSTKSRRKWSRFRSRFTALRLLVSGSRFSCLSSITPRWLNSLLASLRIFSTYSYCPCSNQIGVIFNFARYAFLAASSSRSSGACSIEKCWGISASSPKYCLIFWKTWTVLSLTKLLPRTSVFPY